MYYRITLVETATSVKEIRDAVGMQLTKINVTRFRFSFHTDFNLYVQYDYQEEAYVTCNENKSV